MAAASSTLSPSPSLPFLSRSASSRRPLLQYVVPFAPAHPKLAYSSRLQPRHPFFPSPYNVRFPNQAAAATPSEASDSKVFHGLCFVVGDNIDTDQIIPAEYLTLLPSKPDEYEKLGSYAMVGLPGNYSRFVEDGQTKSRYSVVVAGRNFGCGSSREHAPVCLGAAGVRAVIAESYARIFFRNSVSTGAIYPLESEEDSLSKEAKTGDYLTVDMDHNIVVNHTRNRRYSLKPVGDAGPVIDAGGLFAYARKTGMITSSAS